MSKFSFLENDSVKFVIKLALTLAVLLTIAWKLDFDTTARLLSSISIEATVGCLLLLFVQAWIGSVRLSKLVSLFGHRLGPSASYQLTLQGMFFNQAFTSFLGGDAWRIWKIHRAQVSLTDAASAVTLDRVIGFIVNHVAVVAALPWAFGAINNTVVMLALLAIAAIGLAAVVVFFVLGFLRDRFHLIDLLPPRLHTSRVARLTIELATIGRHLLMNLRDTLVIGLISLPAMLINGLVFFIVLQSLGTGPVLALGCSLLVPFIMEIALLPVSIAGWGVREGAAIIGFGALGLDSEVALAASLAFGLFSLAVGLLGGTLLLVDRRQLAVTPLLASEKPTASSRVSCSD